MDYGSRNGLPANEKVDSIIAYDGRATRERRINHLLGSNKRGHQCRPDDGEGREANTHLFRQILADFIVERPEDNLEDTLMEDEEEHPNPWTLLTDESSCADGFGAGPILTNPEGMEFTYALRFRFDATNNEA
ncbi:hypothetical protein Tco_0598620 [Tanacetum coccineum]